MLPSDLLMALSAYAFVTSITPGPNNAMLLSSGINHGFARTIPHICGVSIGLAVMLAAIGAGLGQLFNSLPWLHEALRWIGAAWMLWLAWKIAHSVPFTSEARGSKPIGFVEAAAFQWLNPKCWVMAMGALTTYMPERGGAGALAVIVILFSAINAPCVGSWAAFGAALRSRLADPRVLRIFNVSMAVLLVLSLYPLLFRATR